MKHIFLLVMMLSAVAGSKCQVNKKNTVSNKAVVKPAVADTVIIADTAKNIIPFEPYETNFQNGVKAAKSTKERTAVFKTYVDALFASSLSEVEKRTLLKNKILHYISIDFYSMYEYRLEVVKETNNAKPLFFISVFRNTATEQQQNAITEYLKYRVASAEMQVYNQTSGKTEQLKRPANWPAGLPLPGYGWGKYISTDDVATPVSMQYHLSAEERYNTIRNYKNSGKNISPDDLAWFTVYEINKAKEIQTAKNNNTRAAKTDAQVLNEMVGQIFRYESLNYFDCTTCKVISYKSKDEITLQCKYGAAKTATYDELVNNRSKYGFHPAKLVLTTCGFCKGNGVVKSSFSHTNDYEYTLGKKITYTKTTITNCGSCNGTGYHEDY